jgi:hypothetical protein
MFRAQFPQALAEARLNLMIYIPARPHFEEESTVFCKRTYLPDFANGATVVWTLDGEQYSSDQLAFTIPSTLLTILADAQDAL